MIIGRDATTGSVWLRSPGVERAAGPERVCLETPPTGWKPPEPVGFKPTPVESEPLTWDGDNG